MAARLTQRVACIASKLRSYRIGQLRPFGFGAGLPAGTGQTGRDSCG